MSDSAFTFLHTADLHIDSPLRGHSRYLDSAADRLRLAAREAFENVVALALERQVRFVVIAGDVFDGDWQDFNSGLWFASELRKLTAAGVRVFLLRGNHDAASKVTKTLTWPEGVVAFPDKSPGTELIDELDVALHGQSYAVPDVRDNLARAYPVPVPGAINIGVLHTGLQGYEGHDRYAPCSVDDLVAKGYDYWALGHIHQREVVRQDPWIVFPGNVQGRHVRELGDKGVTLVHVDRGRIERVEHVACDVARWAHLRLDVGALEPTEEHLLAEVESRLRESVETADGRLLVARVTLCGNTPLDALLRTDRERILNEVRAKAMGVAGELLIEKLRVETRTPEDPSPAQDSAAQGLGALASQLRSAEFSIDELDALAKTLEPLASKLPPTVRGGLDPSRSDHLLTAVDPARRYLASLLGRHHDDEAP